jgi:DNA-directed RNA polymerase specialized sigma24 family protein
MMSATGDEDRVEAVYRSVHPRLWRSLLSYTGDVELASDAEAVALAQVSRRGDAVDDVAAWMWRGASRIATGLLASPAIADPVNQIVSSLKQGEPA